MNTTERCSHTLIKLIRRKVALYIKTRLLHNDFAGNPFNTSNTSFIFVHDSKLVSCFNKNERDIRWFLTFITHDFAMTLHESF